MGIADYRHRLTLMLLLAMAACLQTSPALAEHRMLDLNIIVYIAHDGSARITEKRHCVMTEEGTEGYIRFNNMDGMEVTDLAVTDETGEQYYVERRWEVNHSRNEKRNHCGYNRTVGGVELCWGIGYSGERTYIISYTLDHLVRGYEDYDGFCHSFYEAGGSPAQYANVTLYLYGDTLTHERASIWTFGYRGVKGFDGGAMGAQTTEAMRNGQSIIIMAQFEKGLLQPADQRSGLFVDEVKRPALEDSDYRFEYAGLSQGNNGSSSSWGGAGCSGGTSTITSVMDTIDEFAGNDSDGFTSFLYSLLLFIVAPVIIIYKLYKNYLEKKVRRQHLNTLMGGSKYDDLPYYRQLPLDGNLLKSGLVMHAVNDLHYAARGAKLGVKFSIQQLYDAFLLRMAYKSNITVVIDKNGKQLFRINPVGNMSNDKDLTAMIDSSDWGSAAGDAQKLKGLVNDAGIAYKLQSLLYKAAGSDHLLQPNELKDYVNANPLEWRPFANVLYVLAEKACKESKLQKNDVQQVCGFLHYLKDFSLVAERYIEEVGLWKEYLVFAALFGIADQVRRDMKEIAPDYLKLDELTRPIEETDMSSLSHALKDCIFIAASYMTAAEKAEANRRREEAARRRERAERERSSGGNGWSSFSGGSNHTGGGGSGFR